MFVRLGEFILCLFLICSSFNSGKYDPIYTSEDFREVILEGKPVLDVEGLSPEENHRLLEAILKFGDNWTEVEAYMGSRTKEECIRHFVRLPLEDPFLDQHHNALGLEGSTNNNSDYLPFSDVVNPILTQLAFLASMISPPIAAASAKAALQEFSKLHKKYSKPSAQRTASTPYGSGTIVSGYVADDVLKAVKFPHVLALLPNSDVKESEISGSDEMLKDPANIRHVCLEILNAAAIKAGELADKEYRQLVSGIFDLIQIQMKKIEQALTRASDLIGVG